MVSHSRATAGTHTLRSLNRPRPITISTRGNSHRPLMLIERGLHHHVERIQDTWRVDDEWWREPISRRYYVLVLNNATLRTVYQNLVDGEWYEQRY